MHQPRIPPSRGGGGGSIAVEGCGPSALGLNKRRQENSDGSVRPVLLFVSSGAPPHLLIFYYIITSSFSRNLRVHETH